MARKPTVLAVAPQLPAGCVDFNAFHDAISNGAGAEQAQAAAKIPSNPVPAPTDGDEPLDKETE